jgi:hypothetical protein
MTIDSTIKTWKSDGAPINNQSVITQKTGDGAQETASDFDARQSMLQAQKKAEEAKEAAQGAISRFYEQSQISEKRAEKMVRELDDAIQNALTATQKNRGKKPGNARQDAPDDTPPELLMHGKKSILSRKVLNNGPFGAVSGITKMFGNATKDLDPEVKAEFYQYVMRHSPQLRELIDELTEDKAKIKTDKILDEARTEIIAARTAVNRTQEETNEIKEKARKALVEADAMRKAAEQLVAQVKQSSIGQVAEQVSKAREEAKAVKAAAESAIRSAEEELSRVKAEAGSANNNAVAITLAQEKLKRDSEQLKNYKLQAKIAIKQAMDEATRLKEEAEKLYREAQEAAGKTAVETQRAHEQMALADKKLQEYSITAEKQAYEKFCEEIKAIRSETESTSKMACEAITKAREETRQVHEELETLKKTHKSALLMAQQEAAVAKAEAKNAQLKVQESLLRAQEETRKAKAEAELVMHKASETMVRAKQDLISLTRGEISRARQELEAVSKGGAVPENSRAPRETEEPSFKLDSHRIATILHEIRTPLHSISGFAKLMLEEDVSDPATRKEFLTFMVQQGESLNHQVEDLSGILHNSFGLLPIDKEPIHAAQPVSGAVNGAGNVAGQKKI